MSTTRALVPCLVLLVLAMAAHASADHLCYQLPFGNPNLADGWGSTAYPRTNPHRGVDFAQPIGTRIPAVADGVVRVRVLNGCLGYVVVIGHPDGMFSGYAHMREHSPLAVGTSVRRGDTIGYVGATGSSSCVRGAHLHLTMSNHVDGYYIGTTVDPYAYITSHDTCTTCTTETCNGADDDCDGRTDEGDLCEVALLHAQPSAYAAPRSTDVNADGRADLCARGGIGVMCWPANGSGWSPRWAAIPWTDAAGWDDVDNYATLRMGDVNGDGRADVCARANSGFICALSTGSGFQAHTLWNAGFTDADGWDHAVYYTTMRLADVDADGRDDLCARHSGGFSCWLSNGSRFDRRVDGPIWSDALGWDSARYYGTIRMGDLNADGRADVCARAAAGMQCWLSNGNGFPTYVAGPTWSDANGWDAMQYWSTIRLVDFDADGFGDLCVRSSTDLRCVRGTGAGFGSNVTVAPLSDAVGWNDVSNYATLRTGDIDGDGGDDLCIRSNTGLMCFSWAGGSFVRSDGPAWSDASGWDGAPYYQTLRLADFDGDGLEDACARAGAGWRCHRALGTGFAATATPFSELTDAGNWDTERYWSTILSAGTSCRPGVESCNGRDDDCDGSIDEGLMCSGGVDAGVGADAGTDAGPAIGIDSGTEMVDAAVDVVDASVDVADASTGVVDASFVTVDAAADVDAGALGDGGRPRTAPLGGGCSCRVGGSGSPFGAMSLATAAVMLVLGRRRRR